MVIEMAIGINVIQMNIMKRIIPIGLTRIHRIIPLDLTRMERVITSHLIEMTPDPKQRIKWMFWKVLNL